VPRHADLIKRLLIKLSWYYTKLAPFVVRGPCASPCWLDQKTSNQVNWVLEVRIVKLDSWRLCWSCRWVHPVLYVILYRVFLLPFTKKLRPHEGQVDVLVWIAKPHSGQMRFVRKRSTRRDTMTIPKKRVMRNVTSQKPIDTLSTSGAFYTSIWKICKLHLQIP
jgi:hypothetical protein